MMRQVLGVAALAAALAACGTNPSERTGGGAAAGAATGATIGLVGGPVGVLAGAAIGAGAGAVAGATTSPQDVNLGRPVWNNPEVRTPLGRSQRTAQNSRTRQPRSTAEGDRAYMGGGMVGYPNGSGGVSPATGANAPMRGAAGGGMHRDTDHAPAMTRGPMMNEHMGTGMTPGRTDPSVIPGGSAGPGRVGP